MLWSGLALRSEFIGFALIYVLRCAPRLGLQCFEVFGKREEAGYVSCGRDVCMFGAFGR